MNSHPQGVALDWPCWARRMNMEAMSKHLGCSCDCHFRGTPGEIHSLIQSLFRSSGRVDSTCLPLKGAVLAAKIYGKISCAHPKGSCC